MDILDPGMGREWFLRDGGCEMQEGEAEEPISSFFLFGFEMTSSSISSLNTPWFVFLDSGISIMSSKKDRIRFFVFVLSVCLVRPCSLDLVAFLKRSGILGCFLEIGWWTREGTGDFEEAKGEILFCPDGTVFL